MKRTLTLLLALSLVLGLLSACGAERDVSTPAPYLTPDPSAVPVTPAGPSASEPSQSPAEGPSPWELSEAAFPYSGCENKVERLNAEMDAEALAFYVENAYGLEEGEWEDAAIIRATGASAFEIAVLRCADEDAALRAAQALVHYCVSREGDFTGYAPDQADMAANGSVHQWGNYAALFICPEPGLAGAAWESTLTGQPVESVLVTPEPVQTDPEFPDRFPFDPPNEDDMSLYDTAAILDAWAQSDPSALSDYDRAIYDAAKNVLDRTLRDGMSDYEKEEALYGWMIQNINYDWTHNDVMVSTPRESFTPYGGLVNRTAVCLGYATTFQLLMDLAGVECITVVGAAHQSTGDHAWNMVRLNGNWYCVDVTWDANAREQSEPWGYSKAYWNFFNVTSDVMADENHQWDYANTPEAVTEGNGK